MDATLPQRSRDIISRPYLRTTSPNHASYHHSHVTSMGLDDTRSLHQSGPKSGETLGSASFLQNAPHHEHYLQRSGAQSDPREKQPAMLDLSTMGTSLLPSTVYDPFGSDALSTDVSVNNISTYSSPGFGSSLFDVQFAPALTILNGARGRASSRPTTWRKRMASWNDFDSNFKTRSAICPSEQRNAEDPLLPQSTQRPSQTVPQTFNLPQSSFPSIEQEMNISAPDLQPINLAPLQPLSSSVMISKSDTFSNSAIFSEPPLVTINDCPDESQTCIDIHRTVSKGSRRTSALLSPWADEESSEDGQNKEYAYKNESVENSNNLQFKKQPASLGQHARSPINPSVRSGVEPSRRMNIDIGDIPSLEELEDQRQISEKNAEVSVWLTRSAVGSDSETNGDSTKSRTKKIEGRLRARSTNDAVLKDQANSLGMWDPLFDVFLVPEPGSGLYLDAPSETGDDGGSEVHDEPDSPLAASPRFRDEESYFPAMEASEFISHEQHNSAMKSVPASVLPDITQGITANLAIMRFRQRARELDGASLTATVGTRDSRRRSESDIASVLNSSSISKLLLSLPTTKEERRPILRKGSFLENILPSRNNSNNTKRKMSHQQDSPGQDSPLLEGSEAIAAPKRISSFGRPKSPRVDTTISLAPPEVRSPSAVSVAASGALAHAKQIWRSRSRSDLAKPAKPSVRQGLADLWTHSGGPPMPALASTSNPRPDMPQAGLRDGGEDSGDEEAIGQDGIDMNLSVRTDMYIIPTYDGFKYQARQLNPRLTDILLERVTQEQLKRYKRLIESKRQHGESVKSHTCISKPFCFESGGNWKPLPPRAGNKDSDGSPVSFQILTPEMAEEDSERLIQGTTVVAQFPPGVPLPPVRQLPAEFECPLCFKVKKFYKPSDWTKHVHEDIQPFTCTFADCNEPKSFKRKADWVRHENERHRQLEFWTCNLGECTHTCFRKDNFVQHLVREHKIPEPKSRTGRTGGLRSPVLNEPIHVGSDEGIDDVWSIVDRCHIVTAKQPQDEPCKFCGNISTSWKKLTFHLAKHMEQISMPILALSQQDQVVTDSASLSSGQASAFVPMVPMEALYDLPTFLYEEPAEMDMQTPGIAVNGIASDIMLSLSYPPSMAACQTFNYPQTSTFTTLPETYAASSSLSHPALSRPRAASFNSYPSFTHQGTTFPAAGLKRASMQCDTQQTLFPTDDNSITQDGMSNYTYLLPMSGVSTDTGYTHGD